MQANVGLIGLAVMGQNLVLNLCDHGFKVAVFNRSESVTRAFAEGGAKDTSVVACYDISALVAATLGAIGILALAAPTISAQTNLETNAGVQPRHHGV